jgi:hypothetical protein
MSSLEDGFGGGVDDIVSANAGEPFWEVGYHVFPSVPTVPWCQFANEWHKQKLLPSWDSRTTRWGTWLYYDMLPPPLRLDPICFINLGLSLNNQRAENPRRTPCPRTDC